MIEILMPDRNSDMPHEKALHFATGDAVAHETKPMKYINVVNIFSIIILLF